MSTSFPSHEPPGYECPFCLYVSGGENDLVQQRHVVERTDDTLTFVSPRWWPNNPGAVLVVTTQHIENLYELPEHVGGPLFAATRRAAVAIKSAYECPGTSIRQHNEPAGNQDVWHLHVHVFPRYEGDGLYGARPAWADPDEMAERATALRGAYEQNVELSSDG
ncbi:MAG TPA: HIT family protein [Acidimicrobiales bacterium]|jgi:histidine triad (HIT) family protein|nr:HIT family protein [Acidimicrobiales bacterium]